MNFELKAFFQKQRTVPGNEVCFECGILDCTWASVSFGCYLCQTCSGKHRSLGSHVSFVRSCIMDEWKPQYLQVMETVGNKKFEQFCTNNLPGG